MSQKTKKQQKVVLGFGQGHFVIRADFDGDHRKFQKEVRERIALANDCIRERQNLAADERAERREQRNKRKRRSRR